MADVNKQCSKTFLSSKVKNMICQEGVIDKIEFKSLTNHYTIDWALVESMIKDLSQVSENEEELLENTRKMSSLFLECEELLEGQTYEYYSVKYISLLDWLANKQIFFECLSLVLKTNIKTQTKKPCNLSHYKQNRQKRCTTNYDHDNKLNQKDFMKLRDNPSVINIVRNCELTDKDGLNDNANGSSIVTDCDQTTYIKLSDNVSCNDNDLGNDKCSCNDNDLGELGSDKCSDFVCDNDNNGKEDTEEFFDIGKDESDNVCGNGKENSDELSDNGRNKDDNECPDNDNADQLLSLLMMTSCLERSLGDLYLMKGKQCPSILRDLLNTDELKDILGPVVVSVLKVIIGSPKSLNIRNIAWHGFFSPGELPKRYIYFIMVLIPSIGEILKYKNVKPEVIPHRPPINLPQDVHVISANSKQIYECLNCLIGEDIIFIPHCMMPYFKQALFYYERQRYGYSLCLLWPLLEHSLRCVFAEANNCQYRVLTAESTSFYTTFEEILCKYITSEEDNKLVKIIGEPCMDLLYDVLVYPEGPRLRDRLSHGETDLSDVSKDWMDKTWYIMIYLIFEFQYKDKHKVPEYVTKFKDTMEKYESQYHPIALLKKKVQHVTTLTCNMINWIKIDPTLNSWKSTDGFEVFMNENTNYKELETGIMRFIEHHTSDNFDAQIWYCEVFNHNKDIIDQLLSRKISTLHRFEDVIQDKPTVSSKNTIKESEIVNLLLRINVEFATVLIQLKSITLSREEKLSNKQLRSRQRDNTQKLLFFLPVIHLSMHFLCVFAVYLLYKLQSYTQSHLKQLQRCLKLTLKFSENIRTFTGSDKNKWQEAMELCVKNVEHLCIFLKNFSYS